MNESKDSTMTEVSNNASTVHESDDQSDKQAFVKQCTAAEYVFLMVSVDGGVLNETFTLYQIPFVEAEPFIKHLDSITSRIFNIKVDEWQRPTNPHYIVSNAYCIYGKLESEWIKYGATAYAIKPVSERENQNFITDWGIQEKPKLVRGYYNVKFRPE
jgi:hypothetical protein